MSKKITAILLICFMFSCLANPIKTHGANGIYETDIVAYISSLPESSTERITNISQFKDQDGYYCFAVYNEKKGSVTVYRTKEGIVTQKVKLKMPHSKFGAVDCDCDGYFYMVTGEKNDSDDTLTEVIFLSKYSPKGKLIETVGDNGNLYHEKDSFSERNANSVFYYGNCAIATNGDYIAINYSCTMYNGHQRNGIWMLNRFTLETVWPEAQFYNSHSLGQRVIPYKTGFMFASMGDMYPRAFSVKYVGEGSSSVYSSDIFHFGDRYASKEEAEKSSGRTVTGAMFGDICDLGNGTASFVGLSPKDMSPEAVYQPKNIFIQIFDISKDLDKSSGYITKGKREGTSAWDSEMDYGVKWLTNCSWESKLIPKTVQAVSDDNGNTIILCEMCYNRGVYYFVVDSSGKVIKKRTKFLKTAVLNPCETPVWANGKVWRTGIKNDESSDYLFVFGLEP